MALKAGRMEVDVDADGSGFNRQVRRIMRAGGTQGGHEFSKAWATSVGKEQNTFANAMRSVGDRISALLRRQGGDVKTLSERWQGLGHNTKQWTLIIGAVAAAMQNLSVLSSAAGAGLLILGGAATGALVGVGAFVAAIFRLAGDMEKVPDSVKPAAQAFRDLKTPLVELQNFITERAFAGTERAFGKIGSAIRKLIPAFGPLGDAINRITNGFADWVDSDEGISLLTGLIEGAAPIFERLVGIVGKIGRALLIAFNNPTFQKAIGSMLSGLEGLFDKFSEFVASSEFDVWIDNAVRIFGELGELLGATAGMLHDLVTPEAVDRTAKFLDNLTDFMPHLGELLDILGRLDIFNIITDALQTFGDVMAPLVEPLQKFADGLARVIEISIDQWGEDLKPVAEALKPFADALADLVKNVDEKTIRGLASALLIMGGAIATLSLIRWAGMVTGLTGFFTSLAAGNGIINSFKTSKLKGIASGLGAFALIGAATLIPDSFWEQFNFESKLPQSVLTGAGIGLMFGGWGAAIGAGIGLIYSLFTNFEGTMNDIGYNLLGLFSGGPFGQLGAIIQDFFANMVPQEWLKSDNPLQQIIATWAFFVTDTGTAIQIALGQFGRLWDEMIAGFTQGSQTASVLWGNLMAVVGNINPWNTMTTFVGGWWKRLVDSFTVNVNLARASWMGFWASLPTYVTGTVNRVTATVTAWFVNIRAQFLSGLSGADSRWRSFWNGLLGPVSSAVGRIIGLVNNLIGTVQRALGSVGSLSRSAGSVLGGNGGGAGSGGSFASGGILGGPRRILAGEAGAEAIVPLTRPLSQVDPSVRWLAAFAQGQMPRMASGGVVGGGVVNNWGPGSIVVEGADDSRETALEVVDAIAELTHS